MLVEDNINLICMETDRGRRKRVIDFAVDEAKPHHLAGYEKFIRNNLTT